MTDVVLELRDLCKSFGGVHALRDLTMTIRSGEILGLIGPNGSGKSTTVNVLTGLLPVTSGEIVLEGEMIQRLPEAERVTRGLARTFQTASVFPEFTVREQVMLGAHATLKTHPLASVIRSSAASEEKQGLVTRVSGILDMAGLSGVADDKVATISAAQQRFLMIATALAAQPKVIMLDEPAAGLVAHERDTLCNLIRAIREQGTAVLVIEHHMALIMEVCDRIVVLNFGMKIAEGTPTEIREDRAVIDAYLGEAA